MSGTDRPIWFAGDRGDPMAAAIADGLPAARTRFLDCPADLPRPWPGVADRSPRVIVIHRAHLGETDAGRVARLRRRLGPERRVILCVGPHVRYADQERWSAAVDLILPEALAAETIARHLAEPDEAGTDRRLLPHAKRVAAVSTSFELRATWRAILQDEGYEVTEARDLAELPDRLAAVWDVPVLETAWPTSLATRAAVGPVVAAIGFLDRATRTTARQAGAVACLDLPADLADLVRAVDAMTGLRRDPAHPGMPTPHPSHRSRRRHRS